MEILKNIESWKKTPEHLNRYIDLLTIYLLGGYYLKYPIVPIFAQMVLESGGGSKGHWKGDIYLNNKNCFGIRRHTQTKYQIGERARHGVYNNYKDCIRDYFERLDRFKTKHTKDYKEFVYSVQNPSNGMHYAESNQYEKVWMQLINMYEKKIKDLNKEIGFFFFGALMVSILIIPYILKNYVTKKIKRFI